MSKWEKSRKKFKLKAYQKVCLFVLLLVLILATIIVCIIYRNSIFTENTLVWILISIFVLFSCIGIFAFWRIDKK